MILTVDQHNEINFPVLSKEIQRKRPFTGKGSRTVILLHDTAHNWLWGNVLHTRHLPDLAPSDLYLFEFLYHYLTDSTFKISEEIKKASLTSPPNNRPFINKGFGSCQKNDKNVVDLMGTICAG